MVMVTCISYSGITLGVYDVYLLVTLLFLVYRLVYRL